MAFSNPFDDPQGAFYILRNAQGHQSVAATNVRLTGRLGRCVSAAVTGVLPAVAGSSLAYSDTGEFHPVAGGTMSQHLPLVAAQPGIWMAEKLSDLPSAWSVAHYVELTGEVDAPLLARAVVAGLAQADTLRMLYAGR